MIKLGGMGLPGLSDLVQILAMLRRQSYEVGVTNPGYPVGDARRHGVVGDGVADDTSALLAWLLSAPPAGGTMILPAGTYKSTQVQTLAVANVTIIAYGANIVQPTVATAGFKVTASNSRILGLKVTGPQFAIAHTPEDGLVAMGPSAAACISNVHFIDCEARSWGNYGLHMKFVNDFTIQSCRAVDTNIAGMMIISCKRGQITAPRVTNVVGAPDAYGVTLSGGESASLVTDPLTEDVVVLGGVVKDIPSWTAFDTHGGQRCNFIGCESSGCFHGVVIGPADDNNNLPKWAPHDCQVIGGAHASGLTNGLAGEGVIMCGAAGSVGAPTEKATGLVCKGVSVRGFGTQSDALGGAFMFRDTQGLICEGNTAIEPSPVGFIYYHDNYSFIHKGNTVIDAWSTASSIAAHTYVQSDFNKGIIAENVLSHGSKVAANLNTYGLRVNASAADTNLIRLGINDFGIASSFTVLDGSGKSVLDLVAYLETCRLAGNATPGAATATTPQKIKTVNAVNYFANGEFKTKAATDDFWTPAGVNVPTARSQKYLLLVDDAGAASVIQGNHAATAAGVYFTQVPTTPKTVFAVVTVTNTSGADYVPGTTSLAAAGIAVAYRNGVDPALLLNSR